MEWKSARNALEHALQMEKTINQHLLDLHAHASSCTPTPDPHLSDFLEGHFLGEQAECVAALPFAPPGAADEEGVATSHNLLALGTYSQDAQVRAGWGWTAAAAAL